MGKESSTRIQTSILNRAEKVALVWLAKRQPRWVTSDFLTYLGVLGAVLYAVGCFLANDNIQYLWLASLGMVVNWYGDSLDGTLARVRELQRPIYGFFIDHTLDAGTISIMCIGAGLSPMFRFDIALLVLAGYLGIVGIYLYLRHRQGRVQTDLRQCRSYRVPSGSHPDQHARDLYLMVGTELYHLRTDLRPLRPDRNRHRHLPVLCLYRSVCKRPEDSGQAGSGEAL